MTSLLCGSNNTKKPIFTLYITLKKYAKIRLIYTFINLHVKFYLKVTTTQYKTEKDIIKSIKEFEKRLMIRVAIRNYI